MLKLGQAAIFDLAKMMGFELITVSDGREFAHQVIVE